MVESRRVVITGIGVITPIGIGREAFWSGLRRRESAVREITRFDPAPFKSRIAAEVDGFYASDHVEERRAWRSKTASSTCERKISTGWER